MDTVYLYSKPELAEENAYYNVKITCGNCGYVDEFWIKKGKTVNDSGIMKEKCEHCNCEMKEEQK